MLINREPFITAPCCVKVIEFPNAVKLEGAFSGEYSNVSYPGTEIAKTPVEGSRLTVMDAVWPSDDENVINPLVAEVVLVETL
jgi:hypothetical protein